MANNTLLVLMNLGAKEEIGEETHLMDRFIGVEGGYGLAILEDVTPRISNGSAMVIPAGTKPNVVSDSETEEERIFSLALGRIRCKGPK